MPLLPLASLVSSLASNAVQVSAHVADAGSTKGTIAKPPSKEKKSPEAEAIANAFAACLAVAAASSPAVPLSGTSTTGSKPQTEPVKSSKGIPGVAAPTVPTLGAAAKTTVAATPAEAKTGSLPLAAAATVKKPTPPPTAAQSTLTSAVPAAAHTTPASTHAAHASTPATPPASTTPAAPTPALNPQGKGEIHIGSHTIVEAPVGEMTTPAHEQPAATSPVPATPDPSPSRPQPTTVDSGNTVTTGTPASATHGVENIRSWEEDQRSSLEYAQEIGTQRGMSSLGNNGTRLDSLTRSLQGSGGISASNAASTSAASTSGPSNHGDSRSHADANSSTPAAPVLTDNSVVPTSGVAAPNAASSPTPSPVADQLTQAFLAHADVVQHTGRTDFHLRLDPPQLGSVQIHLTATNHTVSARIVVAQEGTQQLLQGQAHHLRQGLAEAGLSLGSFDVTRDGGGSQGGGQQPPPQQPPLSLPSPVSTPRTATVASTSAVRPTDGINILA